MFWRNMNQFILGLFFVVALIFTYSCSSAPEPVAVVTKKTARVPTWIHGVSSDFKKWYAVGKSGTTDSISSKEIALGLIKDQIQENVDKVLKLEFDLEDSYIDSLVYQIMSRRIDLINSIKKIDSTYKDKNYSYTLISLDKTDYYNEISNRLSTFNFNKKIAQFFDKINEDNLSILARSIEKIAENIDFIILNKKDQNFKNYKKIKSVLNEFNENISFVFDPQKIAKIPLIKDSDRISFKLINGKNFKFLNGISVKQSYSDFFEPINWKTSKDQFINTKISMMPKRKVLTTILELDYKTLLGGDYARLFSLSPKKIKIAIIPSDTKIFLGESINSFNPAIEQSAFNDAVKSCLSDKFDIDFVQNENDSELYMYFDVSSNENLRRMSRKEPFISKAFFILKIDDTTENTQIIEHVIISKAAKNFDFVERAGIKALQELSNESMNVFCN